MHKKCCNNISLIKFNFLIIDIVLKNVLPSINYKQCRTSERLSSFAKSVMINTQNSYKKNKIENLARKGIFQITGIHRDAFWNNLHGHTGPWLGNMLILV